MDPLIVTLAVAWLLGSIPAANGAYLLAKAHQEDRASDPARVGHQLV
jgi:hypothetical protein